MAQLRKLRDVKDISGDHPSIAGMRGWCHIILVGASILANARRSGVIEFDLPALEEGLREGRIRRDDLFGDILRFVSSDPRRASAELNTCMDLVVDGYRRGLQQWVYLLHSDSRVGELCAEILKEFLENFSRERLDRRLSILKPMKIDHLGDPDRFGDGLADLFKTIIDIISYHKAQGDRVFVHATGGYKPETAVAILAANSPMCGAPVFYVHEHFNRVVRIPAMPLSFRPWKRFSDMMNYLLDLGEVNRRGLEERFGREAVEEAIRLGWIQEVDGYVSLSEMGRLLWRRLRRLKAP